MDLGKSTLRLDASDEYTHPIEAAKNFNESMYVNLFDHRKGIGGWFRVGNRPNEGHAEMSFCFYLPGGKVAFMFRRVEIHGNHALDAGGMRFEVIEPLKKIALHYQGPACVLDNPQEMENPARAFADNPTVMVKAQFNFEGLTPVYGGEMVDEQGRPIEEDPEESFARGHYEQHLRGKGEISIGQQNFSLQGFGLRDHSWGPRYWQNLYWYRWLPLVFNDQFAVNVSIVQMASGRQHVWGMVYDTRDGSEPRYDPVEQATLCSALDERDQAYTQRVSLTTESGRCYAISGESLAMIPLRNRRQTDDGEWRHTRITEAMSRFTCDGLTGYGMAEYLDQMVDGKPVGRHC